MPGEQQEVVTAQTVLTESVNNLDLHLLGTALQRERFLIRGACSGPKALEGEHSKNNNWFTRPRRCGKSKS